MESFLKKQLGRKKKIKTHTEKDNYAENGETEEMISSGLSKLVSLIPVTVTAGIFKFLVFYANICSKDK